MSNEQPFKAWLAKVDMITRKLSGVPVSCLPDFAYFDWYEDEATPKETALASLKEAGF